MIRLRASAASRMRAAQVRALKLIPTSGLVEDLVDAVGAAQERSIRLLPFRLSDIEPTGLWIATEGADYVVYPEDATAAERVAIICHELSHILLHHEPPGEGAQLAQMAALVAPDIDPVVARRILARHGYAQEAEVEAEAFGTVLVTHLVRQVERRVFGIDSVSDRLR